MSSAFSRSVLRMGAPRRQSVVPWIPDAVAKSKATAVGRTVSPAVPYSSSLAASASTTAAAVSSASVSITIAAAASCAPASTATTTTATAATTTTAATASSVGPDRIRDD